MHVSRNKYNKFTTEGTNNRSIKEKLIKKGVMKDKLMMIITKKMMMMRKTMKKRISKMKAV